MSYLFVLLSLLGWTASSLNPGFSGGGSNAARSGSTSAIDEWFPRDPISLLSVERGGNSLVGYFPFDDDDLLNYIVPTVQEG